MILSAVVCAVATSWPESVAALLLFGVRLKHQDFKASEARKSPADNREIERRVRITFEELLSMGNIDP
jgi:hypothetical protein